MANLDPTRLLLAAVDPDLIKILAVILFLGLAGIAKLVSFLQEAARAAGAQGKKPILARVVEDDDDEEVDEIENFLRRAQERRVQTAQSAPEASQPVVAQSVDRLAAARESEPLAARELAQPVAPLAAEVVAAEASRDARWQDLIERDLGHLSSPAVAAGEAAEEAPPLFAAEVAAMLSSPDSIRQAIVLGEILRRSGEPSPIMPAP